VGFALSNIIRLGSSLLMTRLLVPQMFGVMAIATLVMSGLAMFSDLGLTTNIIQSERGNDPAFLNTAWVIQILRGLLLWLLALCIALLVFTLNHFNLLPKMSAYSDPELPYVLVAVAVSAFIGGFQSTKLAEANRYLALGRVTLIQLVGQIVGLACMIIWTLIERSIWALVAGIVCSTLTTTLLSHIGLPGVANKLQWDRSVVHEIIHFGKWIFVSSILGFFANNGDRVLLGALVDSTTLGIYSIAANLAGVIFQILETIFTQVSYPAFREVVRERSPHLKHSLYRFHLVAASFTYFCAGLLIVSGNSVVGFLYDRRYEQAGWMLEVLAVALVGLPFNLAHVGLLASGLPRIFTNVIAIRVFVTVLAVPLGFYFFGLPGALWAIALSQLSSAPATIYYQLKYDLFDLSKELLLVPALFAGMIVGKGFTFAIGH
jgi:O-antigen/teichoic acid export membrane protein